MAQSDYFNTQPDYMKRFGALPQQSLTGQGDTSDLFKDRDNSFSLGEYTKLGTGIANAYLGHKNLQLGRDQFDFSKGAFNVNLANQAKLINQQMEDRYRARQQFEGGSTLQSDLDKYTESRKVSGKAI